MYLLATIYQKCSNANKELIDNELLKFKMKMKEQKNLSGGFFTKWTTWSEVKVLNLD